MKYIVEPPSKKYPTKKTIIKSIDNIWSSDLLDMNDYSPKNNKDYRYILVVTYNFSRFGRTIPLKNNYPQSVTNAFPKVIETSRRKPEFLETYDGKDYVNKIFNEFLNNNSITKYSRYTDKEAVFAERFNITIRNLLKKPTFLAGNADWMSELPSVIKEDNNTSHSSTKMKPINASKNSNEKNSF